jgi:hypothetical protein
MSSPDALPPPRDRKQLYERIASGGKDEVILEEMIRLGFWPPAGTLPHDPADEIRRRGELRARLSTLREQAGRLADLARLENEMKKRRMAESRKRREETKQLRLGARAASKAAWQERKKSDLLYLGRGVSAGLGVGERRTSDRAALARHGLPVLDDAPGLAAAMNVTVGELRFLAFDREVTTTSHYRRFTIPKKTGGERVISAPRKRLKRLQHWILTTLLDKLALGEPAHGFRAGRNIVSNARPHVGGAAIINVDLKDFFPTVTYRRVKGLWRKLGYGEEVATILGLLCTEPQTVETTLDGTTYYVARSQRRLPQGAPTSPAITNVLCRRLDARLAGFAHKHGFVYTRYADDITLSARGSDARIGAALQMIRKVAEEEGFAVHPDKIRVQRRGRRQEVTGIVVNERPGVPRDVLRKFRALLHQIERDGPAGKRWGAGGDVLSSALGFASYVAMVDPAKGTALRDKVVALRRRHAS